MQIEVKIGRRNISLIVSERLAEIIEKTNSEVNYKKRIAQMRRCYFGEIEEFPILISPTFIFELEDKLEEERFYDAWHIELLNCPRKDAAAFYTLFREGKSFSYVLWKYHISADELEEKIQSLFTALSSKIKYEEEGIYFGKFKSFNG